MDSKESKSIESGLKRKKLEESLKPTTLYRVVSSISEKILCMKWVDLSHVLLGGGDHSLRLLDVSGEAELKATVNCNFKTVQCLDSTSKESVVTGHEDGSLYLWDLRRTIGSPMLKFKEKLPNTGDKWTSSVKIHPASPYHLISGHYSGELKIWDLRKPEGALHTSQPHHDKLLCMDIEGSSRVLTGGADGRVIWTSLQ